MIKIKVKYLDWTITATCRKHSPHDVSGPGRYTGHVIAALAELESDHDWSDTRPMTSDIVSQQYTSADACLAALVASARLRVDAVEKRASCSAGLSILASRTAAPAPAAMR